MTVSQLAWDHRAALLAGCLISCAAGLSVACGSSANTVGLSAGAGGADAAGGSGQGGANASGSAA